MDCRKSLGYLPCNEGVLSLKIVSRVLTSLVSLVISLLVIEFSLGFVHQTTWVDHVEQQYLRCHHQERYEGFFIREAFRQSDRMFLGDSFTYGTCVGCEEAFPSLLDGFNGGIPGSLTDEWVDLWYSCNHIVQPEELFVCFFLRDGTPYTFQRDFLDAIVSERKRNYSCNLHRFVSHSLLRMKVNNEYRNLILDEYKNNGREWEKAKANILLLKQDVAYRNIAFTLVIIPVMVEPFDESYLFRGVIDIIAEFCKDNGIKCIDVTPAFKGYRGAELWTNPNEHHPNALAHRIIADEIERGA